MRVLHLTLEKKWFDMIESGEKKEEYRALKKYWWRRFYHYAAETPKQFDLVHFRNGYSKGARTLLVECKGWRIGRGKAKWGAPTDGTSVFIIRLGNIITTH